MSASLAVNLRERIVCTGQAGAEDRRNSLRSPTKVSAAVEVGILESPSSGL